jgi:hypothetical protein
MAERLLAPEIWQQRAAQREQARQVSQQAQQSQETRLKLQPVVQRAALLFLRAQRAPQRERRQGAGELLLRRHRVFLFQL